MMHKLTSSGETIVEVLLSAALLGLAITTSFAIARSSLDLGVEAKERSQALKIAESQIELLKFLSTQAGHGSGQGIFDSARAASFCLDRDPSLYPAAPGNVQIVSETSTSPSNLLCEQDDFPSSSLRVAIDYSAEGPSSSAFDNDTFTVSVTWDQVRSGERDQVILAYRLHPVL